MTFDYLNLKLPESKKTGLHTLTLQMKMDKVLFMLHLYPDFELAGALAGVGNIHDFLPFHFGKEIYHEMKVDVRERRKNKSFAAMIGLLSDVHKLWNEDYDIDNFYNMITGKSIVEEEIEEDVEEIEKFYREDDLITNEKLTFVNVIEQIDTYLGIHSKLQTPNVAPGKWWVVYYNNIKVKGKFVPFILMARMNDEGRICYLQGVWPFEYFMNAISRLIPIGYQARKLKPFVYIEIGAEIRKTKTGGVYHHYHFIQRIKSPVPEEDRI